MKKKIIEYANLVTGYIYAWGNANLISICIAAVANYSSQVLGPNRASLSKKNPVTTFLVNVNSNCVTSGKILSKLTIPTKNFMNCQICFFPVRIKRQTNVRNSQLYKSKRLNKYMLNCLEVYTVNGIIWEYIWFSRIPFRVRRDSSRILMAECVAVMSD